MSQNDFDQACRYLAKLDPVGLLCWLLRLRPEAFLFRTWLDTRGIVFPGGSDRTGDTVAHLEDLLRHQIPWALAAEFQLDPDPDMTARLLIYLGHVLLECRPDPEPGSRFQVGGVLVNLRGHGDASRKMEWPEAGLTTHLGVREVNVAEEDGEQTLARIERGELSRCVLPWIVLMQKGDDSAILQRWKEVALAEPDARLRADYGALALVLSEAAKRGEIWKEALKEWEVKRSQQVLEWQEEARKEGHEEGHKEGHKEGTEEAVLQVLEARFGSVPAELANAVRATTDLGTLKRWLSEAAKADTLDAFRITAQV